MTERWLSMSLAPWLSTPPIRMSTLFSADRAFSSVIEVGIGVTFTQGFMLFRCFLITSTFAKPTLAGLVPSMRLRFGHSTMSWSTRIMCPTPRRARNSATIEPIPPTPTMPTQQRDKSSCPCLVNARTCLENMSSLLISTGFEAAGRLSRPGKRSFICLTRGFTRGFRGLKFCDSSLGLLALVGTTHSVRGVPTTLIRSMGSTEWVFLSHTWASMLFWPKTIEAL